MYRVVANPGGEKSGAQNFVDLIDGPKTASKSIFNTQNSHLGTTAFTMVNFSIIRSIFDMCAADLHFWAPSQKPITFVQHDKQEAGI